MSQIYELFIDEDAEIIKNMIADTGRTHLCWYPSSDTDFKSIRGVERLYSRRVDAMAARDDAGPRPLYLFTDARFRELKNEYSSWSEESIIISEATELKLKNPRLASECSNEVYDSDPDENIGRVFLLSLRIREGAGERGVKVIPVLYFIDENLSFMVRSLIANRIKVHTLFHKKDGGGSFGGSHTPMYFIYQAVGYLGLELIISQYMGNGRPPMYQQGFYSFLVEFAAAGLQARARRREFEVPQFLSEGEFERMGWRQTDGHEDSYLHVWERPPFPSNARIMGI